MNQFSYALGTVLKWLRLAVEARKRDIGRRLLIAKTLKEERDAKVAEEETRKTTRNAELDAAKKAFESENADAIAHYNDWKDAKDKGSDAELAEGEDEPELPTFDQQYFVDNWDEERPEIKIPPEVIVDRDNDWFIKQADREEVITQYQAATEEAKVTLAAPAQSQPGKK